MVRAPDTAPHDREIGRELKLSEITRAAGPVLGELIIVRGRWLLAAVSDVSAEESDAVFCSGGCRGLEVEFALADLVRLTGSRAASIVA